MLQRLRGINLLLTLLIAAGTLAGLAAAYRRFHVEESNQRIEIALEWQEVSLLAQTGNQPVQNILTQFKAQNVSALVIAEDTLTTLEQNGSIHTERITLPDGRSATRVLVNQSAKRVREDQPTLAERIVVALNIRGLPQTASLSASSAVTVFSLAEEEASSPSPLPFKETYVPIDYANLRTMGIGLPPEVVEIAKEAGLRIAGRIGNFPGVSETSARNALQNLSDQGATTVIFNGEEVLGYRGLEKSVAAMLRAPNEIQKVGDPSEAPSPSDPIENRKSKIENPLPLNYGAVEFGKQKGDEKLSATLHGDYVRVHSIQTSEMGQLDEEEAIDRFVRAAKERNIRFCYVRLLTFAGPNAVEDNVRFLSRISRGMANGSRWSGGGLGFGPSRRYGETGVPVFLFLFLSLGVAAGTVWAVRAFCPLPAMLQGVLLVVFCVGCSVAAWRLDEAGRKLVALLAGIAFPTVACLRTFPRLKPRAVAPEILDEGIREEEAFSLTEQTLLPASGIVTAAPVARFSGRRACIGKAVRGILLASGITALGIIHVVGLLATRPFMLRANQFLGIKAQHAVPLLLIALCAVMGGAALKGETWETYKARAKAGLQAALNEPARFGLLLLGIIALAGLALVVARTGNDAGVGVSGVELKVRAILDRVLPVRPRTKEFLVGHPAFILGLAWWYRGRRRLAVPCVVIGSLGQVSLLNTFCHIHTPLIVSLWRDSIGLVIGVLLGIAVFLLVESLFPAPSPPASLMQ